MEFLSFMNLSYNWMHLVCIILNYILYRFKNKGFNLISFYSLSFLIFEILFMDLDIQRYIFPDFIINIIDGGDGFGDILLGFTLILLIDLILTAIYFRKEKNKFIISCIIISILIISLLNIFFISIYSLNNNFTISSCGDNIFENYLCGSINMFFILFFPMGILMLVIQTIFAIFFIYKLFERTFIYIKNKIN